jgi:hypothetical protein
MEAIYLLILLILFWLGSLLIESLRRRLRINYERERTAQQSPSMTTQAPRPPPPRTEDWARERENLMPKPLTREPRSRAPQPAGLKNRATLRQAIVWMTILGPCRANDPYE